MKLWILVAAFVILLLTIHSALADDLETNTVWGGDAETIFGYNMGGADYPNTTTIINYANSGTGGVISQSKFYDVICRTLQSTYNENPVTATCEIKFMGAITPQNDGIIQYWLTTPSEKVLPWKQEMIREGNNVVPLIYNLPAGATPGTYTLHVNWIVPDHDPFTATDTFNVTNGPIINPLQILAGGLLLAGLLIWGFYRYGRKEEADE